MRTEVIVHIHKVQRGQAESVTVVEGAGELMLRFSGRKRCLFSRIFSA